MGCIAGGVQNYCYFNGTEVSFIQYSLIMMLVYLSIIGLIAFLIGMVTGFRI